MRVVRTRSRRGHRLRTLANGGVSGVSPQAPGQHGATRPLWAAPSVNPPGGITKRYGCGVPGARMVAYHSCPPFPRVCPFPAGPRPSDEPARAERDAAAGHPRSGVRAYQIRPDLRRHPRRHPRRPPPPGHPGALDPPARRRASRGPQHRRPRLRAPDRRGLPDRIDGVGQLRLPPPARHPAGRSAIGRPAAQPSGRQAHRVRARPTLHLRGDRNPLLQPVSGPLPAGRTGRRRLPDQDLAPALSAALAGDTQRPHAVRRLRGLPTPAPGDRGLHRRRAGGEGHGRPGDPRPRHAAGAGPRHARAARRRRRRLDGGSRLPEHARNARRGRRAHRPGSGGHRRADGRRGTASGPRSEGRLRRPVAPVPARRHDVAGAAAGAARLGPPRRRLDRGRRFRQRVPLRRTAAARAPGTGCRRARDLHRHLQQDALPGAAAGVRRRAARPRAGFPYGANPRRLSVPHRRAGGGGGLSGGGTLRPPRAAHADAVRRAPGRAGRRRRAGDGRTAARGARRLGDARSGLAARGPRRPRGLRGGARARRGDAAPVALLPGSVASPGADVRLLGRHRPHDRRGDAPAAHGAAAAGDPLARHGHSRSGGASRRPLPRAFRRRREAGTGRRPTGTVRRCRCRR